MGTKLTNNIECEIFQVLLEEAKSSYPEDIVVALQSDTVEDISRNVTVLTEWASNWRPSRPSSWDSKYYTHGAAYVGEPKKK